ncbi:MAG: hypothetical protein MK212_13890 [Saprospiraceae bacterium]|nr:hypothetical protein [Saprospiraceae bacterium]
MDNRIVEIPTGRVEILPSGIFIFRVRKGLYMEPKYALPMLERVSQLANHQKIPMLMDIRHMKGASKESIADFKNNSERSPVRLLKGAAVLINSGISRVLGNIMLGIRKPLFPAKLFTKEEDALEWLEQFL